METKIQTDQSKSFAEKIKLYDRIIWIILVMFVWYMIIGSIFERIVARLLNFGSNSFIFVTSYYTATIGAVISLGLLCLFDKDRKLGIWKSFYPTREGRSFSYLGAGLLLGFLMNFFCIAAALLHGDIKLYIDFSASGIPLMLFALLSVFIQSSSEEMWTRGFMYERINVHYPLWVAIVANGTLFGLLHIWNPGITVLAMADLIVCGISFSLLRWYSGSIWICMGVHTMWNYTQNLIFGLPNSGLVSETSIFHMDAANAVSNWVYDYTFGVEGAVPALFVDFLLGAICLYLGWKSGRISELFEVKEKKEQTLNAFVDIG